MAFIIFKDGQVYKKIESHYAELVLGALPYDAQWCQKGDYTWAVQSFDTDTPNYPDMVEALHEWLWRVDISYDTIFREYFARTSKWEWEPELCFNLPDITEDGWRRTYAKLKKSYDDISQGGCNGI